MTPVPRRARGTLADPHDARSPPRPGNARRPDRVMTCVSSRDGVACRYIVIVSRKVAMDMSAGAAGACDFGGGLFDLSKIASELRAQRRGGSGAKASEHGHSGPWDRTFGPKGRWGGG